MNEADLLIKDKDKWRDENGVLAAHRKPKDYWPNYQRADQDYDPEVAEIFIARLRRGETIAAICATRAMPSCRDAYRWRVEVPKFEDQWREARRAGGANKMHHAHEFRLELCRDIFDVYSEGERGLKAILAEHEEYPTLGALNRWKNEMTAVKEMWESANQCRAMVLIEQALTMADETGSEDPRVLKLQIDLRRWMAERLFRAQFGVGVNIVPIEDDLLHKSSKELENSLGAAIGELKKMGVAVPGMH